METRELTDAELFGPGKPPAGITASRELTDAEVFGSSGQPRELSDADLFGGQQTSDRKFLDTPSPTPIGFISHAIKSVATDDKWGKVARSLPTQFVEGVRLSSGGVLRGLTEGDPEKSLPLNLRKPRRLVKPEEGSIQANLDTAAREEEKQRISQYEANARKELPGDFIYGMRDTGREMTDKARANLKEATPKDLTFWQDAAITATRSLGIALPGITASVITKNPAPALASMGLGEFGSSFDENIRSGMDPDKARQVAIMSAGVEAYTEAIPLNKLLSLLPKKGMSIFKKMVKMYLPEIVQENFATLGQDAVQFAAKNPGATFKDWYEGYIKKIPEQAARTTASTLLSSTVQTGGAQIAHTLAEKLQPKAGELSDAEVFAEQPANVPRETPPSTEQPVATDTGTQPVQPAQTEPVSSAGAVVPENLTQKYPFVGSLPAAEAIPATSLDPVGNMQPGEMSDAEVFSKEPTAAQEQASQAPQAKPASPAVQRIEEAIAPIRQRWKGGPEINVVQSVKDLPDKAAPHDVEGAYTANGQVYLVADNLPTADRAKRVLAHEAIGHAGFEKIMGDSLPSVLGEISRLEKTDKAVMEAARTVDENQPGLDQTTRAKEIIAVMAENGVQNSVIRRVIHAIRKFLRDAGIDVRLDANDIAGLLRKAEKSLEKPSSKQRPAKRPAQYSRKGYTESQEYKDLYEQALKTEGRSKARPQPSPNQKPGRTVEGQAPRERWHQETVVRGTDGRLTTVFRGSYLRLTPDHFALPSLGHNSKHPTSGLGAWLTMSQEEAPRFGPNVESFHLDIRNPAIFYPGRRDLPVYDLVKEYYQYRERLRARGFDAIVLDMRDLGGTVHFAVFDPSQVIYTRPLYSRKKAVTDDITPALRDAVMQGQALFSRKGPDKTISDFNNRAVQRLGDALGIPKSDVQILKPEAARQPGLLNPFRSPNKVAEKFPVFRPFFASAERAHAVQERLRILFQKRMSHVDQILREGKSKLFGKNTYEKNANLLQDIRLTEDMLGREFSDDILRSEFNAPESVIRAKKMIRSAYDHALTIANKQREMRGKTEISRRTGYVPHFFHNYFIIGDGQVLASARTLSEATKMGNDAVREGKKNVIVRPKQFQFPGGEVQAAVIGDIDYFKMQDTLQKTHEMSLEEANKMMEGLVRMKGRSRFVGNFLQRKGAKGFEQDLAWVDRHYFNMISRYASLDFFKSRTIGRFERTFGAFDKAHKGMAQYVKNYINDINGVPTAVEDLMNATIARTPWLGRFLGKYLGDRPALHLAGMTTGAVAIAKLGLYNASAAAVNLTQLNAIQALIGPVSTANGLRLALQAEAVRLGRKVGAFQAAHRDLGVLKQAGVDYAQGLESGSGYSKVHQLGAVFKASTAFFQGAERILRQTAVLGAYHKYLAKNPGKGKEALAYAKQVNNRANYDYSIVDTPSFIRRTGPLGQILFQFKKYPVKSLELVASLKGAEHAKFWIPLFLMAGYFALPGLEALARLLKNLFDLDMELEMKKYLLDWAGDDKEKMAVAKTIMYGLFSLDKLGSVDISRRIGHGDFIPSELSDLYGPGISTVVRTVQLASREEWIAALKAISTAPGNIVEAIASDGEITDPWRRGRLSTRLKGGEVVAKGLGFRPTSEALESDVSRIIQYETKFVTMARQRVIDQIIIGAREGERAEQRGDKEGMENAERRIKTAIDHAEKHDIPLTPEQIKNEIKAKNLTKAERAWLGSSKIIKARIGRVMEAYQAETEK